MIVYFKTSGNCYFIDERTTQKLSTCSSFDLLVVDNVVPEILNEARKRGFKILECNESEDKCLQIVRDTLFRVSKSCKFA